MNIAAHSVHWTEPRVEPLDLTDTEILDFLNESAFQVTWNRGTPENNESFSVHCDLGINATAPTLRIAARTAAAIAKEANE